MNDGYSQYAQYVKPWFSPPAWIFGPVWSVLYIMIAISFGYVFLKIWHGQIPKLVALPFVINIIANASFTPVQFGLSNLPLASIIILVVLLTIPWMMWVVWPYAKWVAYMQIPYLVWVSFATVLQLTVTYLNR
ncbi:MAG: tryptophan-rich sensory protein [Candidatus Pacebacteria bacterium]|nr:tryptophan-rich sensory protein [Candidatus Paceibacterota bacterium]MBP9842784.1 tryptophan-rich sensory protein [Candidatus Paceibacterota bacterium]